MGHFCHSLGCVTHAKISVGPPFFNVFYVPLGCALAAVLALLPGINGSAQTGRGCNLFWSLDFGVCWWRCWSGSSSIRRGSIIATAVGLGVWIAVTHGVDLWRKRKALSRAYIGMTMAHLGFAATIIGIAITATQSVERDMRMLPQDTVELAGMESDFPVVKAVDGPNYRAQQGVFSESWAVGTFPCAGKTALSFRWQCDD